MVMDLLKTLCPEPCPRPLLPVGEHTQTHNASNQVMVLLFNFFQIVYIFILSI